MATKSNTIPELLFRLALSSAARCSRRQKLPWSIFRQAAERATLPREILNPNPAIITLEATTQANELVLSWSSQSFVCVCVGGGFSGNQMCRAVPLHSISSDECCFDSFSKTPTFIWAEQSQKSIK